MDFDDASISNEYNWFDVLMQRYHTEVSTKQYSHISTKQSQLIIKCITLPCTYLHNSAMLFHSFTLLRHFIQWIVILFRDRCISSQ